MSVPPDDTLADPEQLIADPQRQLAECKAELGAGINCLARATLVLQPALASSP